MPFLDLPARFADPGLMLPGVKPVSEVEIDWSHPLTRGLRHFWLHGVSLKSPDLVQSEPTWSELNVFGSTTLDRGLHLFNGTTDYLLTAGDNYTFGSEGSHVAYCMPLSVNAHRALCSSGASDHRIRITTSGNVQYTPSSGSAETTGTATAGEWHLVAGGFDGSNIFTYMNGEYVTEVNANTPGETNPFNLAARGSGASYFFDGYIAYSIEYDRVLSAEELDVLYRDPYCMLQPVARPSIFLPEAATGGYFLQLPPEFADPSIMIPRHKPVGPVVAKHGHKGQKVVHWYDFGGETAQDLISKHVAYPVTDFGTDMWDFTRVSTPKGSALHSPNGNTPSGGSIRCDLYTGAFTAPTVPTTFIYHLKHDASSATGNPLELAAGTWNQDGWTLIKDEFSSNVRWRCGFYYSGGSSEYLVFNTPTADAEEVVVVHYDPDNENCWMVVNDQIATNISTFQVYDDNTSVNGGTARMFNGWEEELQGKFWMHARLEGRVMSEAELLDIAADPYQFLQPAQAPMIWVPDAASPTGGYWIPDPRWENPGLMIPGFKPPGEFEVLQGHLGQRVKHWYHLGAANRDLVTGAPVTFDSNSGGTWSEVNTPIGDAMQHTETSDNVHYALLVDDFMSVPTTPTTWIFRLKHDGTARGNCEVTRNSWQNYGLGVRVTSTNVFLSFNWTSNSPALDVGNTITNDEPVTILVHTSPSGDYVVTATSAGSSYTNTSLAGIFAEPDEPGRVFGGQWAASLEGEVWFAAKLEGPMTEGMARAIVQDPYQFLIPA